MIHDNSVIHDARLAEIAALLKEQGFKNVGIFKSGSAYYGKENPPDYDIVVRLLNCNLSNWIGLMKGLGWSDCAEDAECIPSGGDERTPGYGLVWCSVRKDDVNIIATTEDVWFYREQAATELVRKFALEDGEPLPKEEVIELFRLVRDGKEAG